MGNLEQSPRKDVVMDGKGHTMYIISMAFVLSLTQMLVFLSLYVMLSILLSILVCAAARTNDMAEDSTL